MEIKTANKNDFVKASELLYSSGMEPYDYLFQTKKHQAIDFIKYEFLSGKGLCGYQNVFGLYEKNSCVGTGCFFDGKNYTKRSYQTLSNIFKYYSILDIIPMVFRCLKMEKITKRPKDGEIYLSNFAVVSSERKKGFGTSFIKKSGIKYKNMGYSIMGLDVDKNNRNAKNLYSKLGFIEKEEKKLNIKRINLSKVGLYKMEMILV